MLLQNVVWRKFGVMIFSELRDGIDKKTVSLIISQCVLYLIENIVF
jgi:hypothetical protein